MRKALSAMFVATAMTLGLATTAAEAALITINFDGFPDDTILPVGTFDGIGVHFNETLQVNDGDIGDLPNSPPNTGFNFDSPGGDITGFFTLGPVSFLSVWAGDVGGDTDTVTLNVYNAANVLIGTTGFTGVAAQTLSLSVAGIARFEILQSGLIAIDDFTFDTQEVIPEPASLLLLGTGLVAVARRARRARR